MIRLQHYIEFIYLLVAVMAAVDVIGLRKMDHRFRRRELATLALMTAAAPVTLVVVLCNWAKRDY